MSVGENVGGLDGFVVIVGCADGDWVGCEFFGFVCINAAVLLIGFDVAVVLLIGFDVFLR